MQNYRLRTSDTRVVPVFGTEGPVTTYGRGPSHSFWEGSEVGDVRGRGPCGRDGGVESDK